VGIQSWHDAPEIHPSQIRVGDVIGTLQETSLRYTVKLISVPQSSPRRWTFFGRDDRGSEHANMFTEDDLVRRYAKAA
jgi:vacuolar-type H+-ATPase catalytic subunit A/Vma1